MDRPPTFNDVAQCYRLFLERDVEDATTAVMQMADVPTLWGLINRFAVSSEALYRKIHRASGLISDIYDPSLVRMEVSDAQREELVARTLARWERCGRGFAYDHFFAIRACSTIAAQNGIAKSGSRSVMKIWSACSSSDTATA